MDTIPHYASHGKHYIYTLAYPDGRVFYVGKGVGNRINHHERDAKQGRGRNSHKLNIIKKIWREGGEVRKSILAYFETHEEACLYEIALIFFMDGLTNLTYGGEGSLGYVASQEARNKISAAAKGRPSHNKGKPLSEKQKSILIAANTGRKQSAEVVARRVARNTGQKRTEETKQKMAQSQMGKTASAETRRKLSIISKGRPRKPLSEKTRQKISDRQKGKPESLETRRKMSEQRKGKPLSSKGKSLSEEHKRKLSEARKGLPWSDKRRAAQKRNALQLQFPEMGETSLE